MPSSTSSFNPIYGKTLLAIVLGMTAALGLVKAFVYANDASSETIMGRVLEAKAALPRIVTEPEDLVMVFGSSMVHAGFSPREFDQHMRDRGIDNSKAFNFGFGGLNPFYQDYLTRRIKEVFDDNNKRLKLAVIEFNPFQTTIRRYERATALEDSFITMLGTEKEFREILLQDPTRGVRLYNIKYLRDSISAEMITSFFGGIFREPRTRTELERDEELQQKNRELGEQLSKAFERDYPDYDGSQWSYQWQGGGTIPAERDAETLALFDAYYASMQDDARFDDARLNRIHTADILDMNFSEELITAFIRIVNQFKTFSDHVEVVLLPRNTAWINYTAGGKQRLAATIKRIEQATGITIKSHQDLPVIKPSMFRDATHLNAYQGAVAYTKFLADEYHQYLRR